MEERQVPQEFGTGLGRHLAQCVAMSGSRPGSARTAAASQEQSRSLTADAAEQSATRLRHMQYLDSASRDRADTLYTWLESVLPDAVYFGCQTGYFAYDGIYPLEARFVDLLKRSGQLRLVVGANEASLRSVDLEDVLDLFDQAPGNHTKSLVVAAADDVLMHSKTFYVEKADGSRYALIGSANLTHSGLSRNIEAGMAIDSTNDPGAPFDQIRNAIEIWHSTSTKNSRLVTRPTLAKLIADGVVDQPRSPRSAGSPRTRRARAVVFPAIGAILRLPRKKRVVAPPTPTRRPATPQKVPIGTLATLPGGAVGVIKRLTALDTKGFNGGAGTPYIALSYEVAAYLPMTPYGKNSEPRTDVSVEARIDTVPEEVINSGSSTTNITHVGAGGRSTSHSDLRFNYLTTVRRGIEDLAAKYGVRRPDANDLVALEFQDGVRVRVTFITEPAAISNLTPLLDQRGKNWGWLPPSIISPWADDVDDA